MYKTFSEMNELLRIASNINPKNCNGKNIKAIAAELNISTAMLYKWRSGQSNLALDKLDSLLLYFENNEPVRLEMAERMMGW